VLVKCTFMVSMLYHCIRRAHNEGGGRGTSSQTGLAMPTELLSNTYRVRAYAICLCNRWAVGLNSSYPLRQPCNDVYIRDMYVLKNIALTNPVLKDRELTEPRSSALMW
jgi:hypothetical protein